MQFIFHYTVKAKSTIKCLLKKEQLLAKWQRDLNAKKIDYHDNREKKRLAFQKRCDGKKESVKQ